MNEITSREKQIEFFSKRFGITTNELTKFISYYNEDFSAYDNHVYEHVGSRIAHWWNFEDHDWFSKRIDIYLDYLEILLKSQKNITLIDIGFSVPYAYTRKSLICNNNLSLLLIDKEKSAKRFFNAISEFLSIHRKYLDNVLINDIEITNSNLIIYEELNLIKNHKPPNSVIISASEVIEHLDNQDKFWELLKNIKNVLKLEPIIYATLPVGKKIPSHSVEFLTASDAFTDLSNYLNIIEKWFLHPSQSESVSPFLQECVCVLGTLK